MRELPRQRLAERLPLFRWAARQPTRVTLDFETRCKGSFFTDFSAIERRCMAAVSFEEQDGIFSPSDLARWQRCSGQFTATGRYRK